MKFFVVSDVHGFYNELIRDLKNAGWDDNNSNHILIVCGDIFDRGTQPLEVYNFLRSIPKERRILIRGNHEQLFKDLVDRQFPEDHDHSNGTYKTVLNLCGYNSEDDFWQMNSFNIIPNRTLDYYENKYGVSKDKGSEVDRELFWNKAFAEYSEYRNERLRQQREVKRQKIWYNPILKEICDWIDSDEWVNYFETKDYIFVHGFIPYNQDYWTSNYGYIFKTGPKRFREDWRNATQDEWWDATWFNWNASFRDIKNGLNQTSKYIVVGHWHTSDLFNNLRNSNAKKYYINNNPIFKSKKYKIIGLDTCTVVTKKINVLTFEE